MFAACCVYVFCAWAQNSNGRFVVKSLGLENGLSNNYVVDAVGDKNGDLWFATEEGLNRFDGARFYTYYKRRGNANGLTGNEFNSMLDDPKKPLLWIATQRDGLNAYDYKENRFYSYKHNPKDKNSLATNDITYLKNAPNNKLWVATYWQGIDLFDKETARCVHYNTKTVKGLGSNQVWCLLDAGNGLLYVGHVNAGMSIVDVHTRRAHNFRHNPSNKSSIASNEVTCIYKDQLGYIWVGTSEGLDLFDSSTGEFYHVSQSPASNHRIFGIEEHEDGKLWVATEQGGVVIFDLKKLMFHSNMWSYETLQMGEDDKSLTGNSVRCILEDDFGNIWLGLYGSGLNFLTYDLPLFGRITYSSIDKKHHLSNESAIGLAFDYKGNLWVGTDGDGINVFSPTHELIAQYPKEAGASVQAVLTDKTGRLWFGSFDDGVSVYNSASGGFHHLSGELDKADVRSFYEDRKNGKMLVGTSNGIYYVDMQTLKPIKHISLDNNFIRSISRDLSGNFWIGTFGGGLYVYSPNFKLLKVYNTDNGFPSNTVNDVSLDRKGRMWVATSEGAALFTRENGKWSYKVYEWESGLSNIHVHSVSEDENGNIWMGTNLGISCFKRGSEKAINYTYDDNVCVGNFTGACAVNHVTGQFVLGSSGGGLCYFYPEEVLASRKAPDVLITALTLYKDGYKVDIDSTLNMVGHNEVECKYNENTLFVAFNTRNYALNGRVEYSYYMEGMEDKWITTKQNGTLVRNLPPGVYRLRVRCRLHNQPWSKETSLKITINPPFWLSWWAKIFYFLVFVAVSLLVVRIYNRHLRLAYLYDNERRKHEQEQMLTEERMRFFTNVTHELRTPLTLIIAPLEDISKAADLPAHLKHKLALIHTSAVRLNNLITRLLDFRKTETDSRKLVVERCNLVTTVREACLKYEELNSKPDVAIHFSSCNPIIEAYHDKEVITIIVDNLVSNAIKYTDSGSIDISVCRKKNDDRNIVVITVADTGYGISEEALPHIFDSFYQERGAHQASGTGIGLAMVKKLVSLHQGEISVESKQGVGTTFKVTIYSDNLYPLAPRAEHNKKETAVEAKAEQVKLSGNADHRRMLIVEDNKDIQDYIAESFNSEYDIIRATNGQEGLDAAFEYTPDVIISDVMMPVMNGVEMCKRIKHDVRTSHILVILLTAKDSIAAKEEGYEAGADSYITKPFTHNLLASRIKNLRAMREKLTSTMQSTSPDNIEEKRAVLRESMNKLDQEFFDQLNKVIENNITGDIDVQMLASELNMSASTLYRKMKSLLGVSANEYIRKFKMRQAEKLLLDNKYSISEIAYMVGMNSAAYFRQCFKAEFGMLPSEYLKKIKEE
ncbi:MAG: response regulator [Prevotella sp.]|nr:response regulator [Prevotella sp.]